MCFSWCGGSSAADPAAKALPDVPFTNKLCVGFAGLLGAAISVPICYYHNEEIKKAQNNLAFTCTYINSLGGTVDVGDIFINAMTIQFWVYLSLSILVIFTLLGAYCAQCRCLNACIHSLGFFAHAFAVVYLGVARFSKASRLCTATGAPL